MRTFVTPAFSTYPNCGGKVRYGHSLIAVKGLPLTLNPTGSFCGYRNIQMLISYIIASQSTGAQLFGESFPTIFQIQDLIENAWDDGFNSQGRSETGGVKGTRKYIGTPEVRLHVNISTRSGLLTSFRLKLCFLVFRYRQYPILHLESSRLDTYEALGAQYRPLGVKMARRRETSCCTP